MSIIAAEDIGLAYPSALSVVNSGLELVLKTGLPEAQIILAELTIFLATLPKSNSAYLAIKTAMNDIENINIGDVPSYLKDAHYNGAKSLGVSGYKYPHDYDNNYVKQEYMPKELEGKIYYNPQRNKYEENINRYWNNIK